ncbi:MAG: hypothetical protein AAF797_14505 [Planctomycetota bacterium]
MVKRLAGTVLLSGVVVLASAGCDATGGMNAGFARTTPSANRDAGQVEARETYRRDSTMQAQIEAMDQQIRQLTQENASLRAQIARLQGQ